MTLILEIIYLCKFANYSGRGNSSAKALPKKVIEKNEEWIGTNLTPLIEKHVLINIHFTSWL